MNAAQPNAGLVLAVTRAGSQSALGRLIGRNQSTIHDWWKKGKPLPAEYVPVVSASLAIPRHQIRPDLYSIGDASAVPVLPVLGKVGVCDRPSNSQLGEPAR